MKQLCLLAISLLAVSACAPQPTGPIGAVAGSPTNTTTAFDGNYGNLVVTGKTPSGCPDLPLTPYFPISNGRAYMQGYNLTFQGYVTPQGGLTMTSGLGQTFQGQIDPNFVLTGRASGPNCLYDASWTRIQAF